MFRESPLVGPALGRSNTAGMMAVMAGGLLFLTALLAPRKGILSRGVRSYAWRYKFSVKMFWQPSIALSREWWRF